jgi:hypothetical protein
MKAVKKTSAKKYQAGGTQPKDVKGPSGSKMVKKSGKTMGKMAGGPDYLKDPMSGTSDKGTPVTGKTGYVPPKKKGGTAKPKAAYGMAVKPSMMKKGGAAKKKK